MDTARLGLPMLAAGQAQKEMAVNESLLLLDLAVQAAVVAVGVDAPPAAPAAGQAWIVGVAPVGAWAGRSHAIAGWSGGGWRFVAARAGMGAWSIADGAAMRFDGTVWRRERAAPGAAIAAPAGGPVVDAEARAAIASVLAVLGQARIIATV